MSKVSRKAIAWPGVCGVALGILLASTVPAMAATTHADEVHDDHAQNNSVLLCAEGKYRAELVIHDLDQEDDAHSQVVGPQDVGGCVNQALDPIFSPPSRHGEHDRMEFDLFEDLGSQGLPQPDVGGFTEIAQARGLGGDGSPIGEGYNIDAEGADASQAKGEMVDGVSGQQGFDVPMTQIFKPQAPA